MAQEGLTAELDSQAEAQKKASYVATQATLDLFARYCGIDDEELLRRVIAAHEAGITRGFPFGCVRDFRFAHPRIEHHPFFLSKIVACAAAGGYGTAGGKLALLDIGCCMGTDLRRVMMTSPLWTPEQVLGIDIQAEFMEIGMDILYQDRSIMEDSFIAGNLLDDESALWNHPRLQGGQRFDFVYSGSLLHLLSQGDGEKLASTVLNRLLKEGGVFFGRTAGWREDVHTEGHLCNNPIHPLKFLYPPTALKRMLERHGFQDVQVSVDKSEDLPYHEMPDNIMMVFSGTK